MALPGAAWFLALVLCTFSRHAHGAWWRDTHLAERILNARAYNQSLARAELMLPELKANGYSVINLDWPVESGPVVLYGGFGARDYMQVEPSIGGEAAWRSFTAAAHRLDMKVISWFNPSYMWTEAPAFVSAQADARRYFKGEVDYDVLPANSTARWFKWLKSCPGAPGQPVCPADCRSESQCGGVDCRGKGCGGGNCSLIKGNRWIHSPAADACYFSVFADQPSGDWSRPEWVDYMRSVFKHWVEMGHDGFM
jgi:glycosidase